MQTKSVSLDGAYDRALLKTESAEKNNKGLEGTKEERLFPFPWLLNNT